MNKSKLIIILSIILISLITSYFSLNYIIKKKKLENNPSISINNFTSLRDQAITAYLLLQNSSTNFCVFENLNQDSDLFPISIWARCSKFTLENNKLKEINGISLPILIDYPNELSYFDLSKFSHKSPRDGSLYSQDIKTIFSKEIQKIILNYQVDNLNQKIAELALQKLKGKATQKQITITGNIICLSPKNISGPQTMECALGLKDKNGIEYGLSDPQNKYLIEIGSNKTVTINGTFTPKEDTKYKSIGTIEIESLLKEK